MLKKCHRFSATEAFLLFILGTLTRCLEFHLASELKINLPEGKIVSMSAFSKGKTNFTTITSQHEEKSYTVSTFKQNPSNFEQISLINFENLTQPPQISSNIVFTNEGNMVTVDDSLKGFFDVEGESNGGVVFMGDEYAVSVKTDVCAGLSLINLYSHERKEKIYNSSKCPQHQKSFLQIITPEIIIFASGNELYSVSSDLSKLDSISVESPIDSISFITLIEKNSEQTHNKKYMGREGKEGEEDVGQGIVNLDGKALRVNVHKNGHFKVVKEFEIGREGLQIVSDNEAVSYFKNELYKWKNFGESVIYEEENPPEDQQLLDSKVVGTLSNQNSFVTVRSTAESNYIEFYNYDPETFQIQKMSSFKCPVDFPSRLLKISYNSISEDNSLISLQIPETLLLFSTIESKWLDPLPPCETMAYLTDNLIVTLGKTPEQTWEIRIYNLTQMVGSLAMGGNFGDKNILVTNEQWNYTFFVANGNQSEIKGGDLYKWEKGQIVKVREIEIDGYFYTFFTWAIDRYFVVFDMTQTKLNVYDIETLQLVYTKKELSPSGYKIEGKILFLDSIGEGFTIYNFNAPNHSFYSGKSYNPNHSPDSQKSFLILPLPLHYILLLSPPPPFSPLLSPSPSPSSAPAPFFSSSASDPFVKRVYNLREPMVNESLFFEVRTLGLYQQEYVPAEKISKTCGEYFMLEEKYLYRFNACHPQNPEIQIEVNNEEETLSDSKYYLFLFRFFIVNNYDMLIVTMIFKTKLKVLVFTFKSIQLLWEGESALPASKNITNVHLPPPFEHLHISTPSSIEEIFLKSNITGHNVPLEYFDFASYGGKGCLTLNGYSDIGELYFNIYIRYLSMYHEPIPFQFEFEKKKSFVSEDCEIVASVKNSNAIEIYRKEGKSMKLIEEVSVEGVEFVQILGGEGQGGEWVVVGGEGWVQVMGKGAQGYREVFGVNAQVYAVDEQEKLLAFTEDYKNVHIVYLNNGSKITVFNTEKYFFHQPLESLAFDNTTLLILSNPHVITLSPEPCSDTFVVINGLCSCPKNSDMKDGKCFCEGFMTASPVPSCHPCHPFCLQCDEGGCLEYGAAWYCLGVAAGVVFGGIVIVLVWLIKNICKKRKEKRRKSIEEDDLLNASILTDV